MVGVHASATVVKHKRALGSLSSLHRSKRGLPLKFGSYSFICRFLNYFLPAVHGVETVILQLRKKGLSTGSCVPEHPPRFAFPLLQNSGLHNSGAQCRCSVFANLHD